MDKRNITLTPSSSLDVEAANKLLTNIYTACDLPPSAVPVKLLENWSDYSKFRARAGQIISFTMLMAVLLLPMMFFHPAFIAQRTSVDYSSNAVYEINVRGFLPVRAVSASLNDTPVCLSRMENGSYRAEVTENGLLTVSVTSFNGQTTCQEYQVAYIDTEDPVLADSYTEEGVVYLVLLDTYSGVDFASITAIDSDGHNVEPFFLNEEENTVSYVIPEQPVQVFIPDHAGNTLKLLISPAS